jgi:hypothetical protein
LIDASFGEIAVGARWSLWFVRLSLLDELIVFMTHSQAQHKKCSQSAAMGGDSNILTNEQKKQLQRLK